MTASSDVPDHCSLLPYGLDKVIDAITPAASPDQAVNHITVFENALGSLFGFLERWYIPHRENENAVANQAALCSSCRNRVRVCHVVHFNNFDQRQPGITRGHGHGKRAIDPHQAL